MNKYPLNALLYLLVGIIMSYVVLPFVGMYGFFWVLGITGSLWEIVAIAVWFRFSLENVIGVIADAWYAQKYTKSK